MSERFLKKDLFLAGSILAKTLLPFWYFVVQGSICPVLPATRERTPRKYRRKRNRERTSMWSRCRH